MLELEENYFFSVVIPCYNSEATILRCLNSVNNQIYRNYELIIVDDASTDTTRDIIKNFLNCTSELNNKLIVNDKNSGPGYSRNKGVINSKGKYIAFLDADDFWLENHLLVAVKTLNLLKKDSILSHYPITVNTKEYSNALKSNKDPTYIKIKRAQFLFFLIMQRYYSTISIIVPKFMFEAAGGFPTSRAYAEDLELFIKIRILFKDWFIVKSPRTAIVGKCFIGSSRGLSANTKKMHEGSILALRNSLKGSVFKFMLPLFISIFWLKYARRLLIIKLRKRMLNFF